ncbi:MAG: hypothetical protein ACTMKW_10225, partial [Brevibacterium aurantiacum]
RAALDVRSPSRVMRQIGEYTGNGLVDGILSTTRQVERAAVAVADAASRGMSSISAPTIAGPTITPGSGHGVSPYTLGSSAGGAWGAAATQRASLNRGANSAAPSTPGGATFMPGSIVVQGSLDPRRTALETVDRISEKVSDF